jgi:protein transport protein SEC61 subunit gamma and related proteins
MEEEYKETLWIKFKRFLVECRRVLRVTKKPNSLEFKTIVKVSGLGMGIIGLLGFVIQIVKQIFF